MALARADQLCDAAKVALEAAVAALPAEPGITVEVILDDEPEIDPEDMPVGKRRVYVGWSGYRDAGAVSRGEDATLITLRFACVERCPKATLVAGRVPLDWRRVRSGWVDALLVEAFGDARKPLDGATADSLEEVEFDRDAMRGPKLFWCEAAVTFLDHQPAG